MPTAISWAPQHQIRATYGERSIRVYQAYGDAIADAALREGRFVSPPFKMDRMTWIKPSFLWMMYRAGWGLKEEGQRRILAIDLSRTGFDWALEHSCPTRPPPSMTTEDWLRLKEASPVRVQWDPERDLFLRPLPYRTIQLGLSKEAIRLYVREWVENITEITATAHSIHELVVAGRLDEALASLPEERPYRAGSDEFLGQDLCSGS